VKGESEKSHCALVIQYTSELNNYFSVFKQEDGFDHERNGKMDYEGMKYFHS